MALTLRQLEHFSVLADTLHFTRAAERLGIAQPPLSQSIQALEREVGCQLVRRRPEVRLTPEGQALLSHARRILAGVDNGLVELRRLADGTSGTIRVGFASSTLASGLPLILKAFRRLVPSARVELRELSSATQLSELESGTIDVGFIREIPEAPGLTAEPIASEPFILVAPASSKVGRRATICLSEMQDQDWVLFPPDVAPGLRQAIDRLFQSAGFEPKITQLAREWFTIVGLVEAGGGLSIVPSSFGRLRWGGVKYVGLDGPAAETVTSVCYLDSNRMPLLERFLAVVRSTSRSPLSE